MQQLPALPARVEMINITKTYGSIRSLRGVNLQLAPAKCSVWWATTAPANRR